MHSFLFYFLLCLEQHDACGLFFCPVLISHVLKSFCAILKRLILWEPIQGLFLIRRTCVLPLQYLHCAINVPLASFGVIERAYLRYACRLCCFEWVCQHIPNSDKWFQLLARRPFHGTNSQTKNWHLGSPKKSIIFKGQLRSEFWPLENLISI